MKNKWDHEVINSQEDEDGFSLNPGYILYYESAIRNQDTHSTKNSANTGPGSTETARVAPGTRRRASQLILSSSVNLQSQ